VEGGPCFAWAYREIAESSDAELFIILGIAHTGTKNLFVLTDKTFETPFGNVETDKDFLNSLQKRHKTDYFEDEFVHRDEHSIGFHVSSLKETIKESGKKICIIASVDLAHVGNRFGDTEHQDEAYLDKLRADDTDMLKYVENLDAEGFSNSIRKEHNSRKICGYPAIYTLMNVIDASEGKLLKYSQHADQTNSTVSFASMSFY